MGVALVSFIYSSFSSSDDKAKSGQIWILASGLVLLAILHVLFANQFSQQMREIGRIVNPGDWLVRGGRHLRRDHAKTGAAISYIGHFARTLVRAYSETQLPYPLDHWFFLAHRPLFTWLCFGGIQAVAAASFAALVTSDALGT